MLKSIMVCCLLAPYLTSCDQQYKVTTEDGPNWPHVIYAMRENLVAVDSNPLGPDDNIQVNAEFFESKGHEPNYYGLQIEINLQNGISIIEGSSLIVNIDTGKTVLTGTKCGEEPQSVQRNDHRQCLWFRADRDFLNRLGNANSVEFQFKYEEYVLNGKFSAENIERFKDFSSKYIK